MLKSDSSLRRPKLYSSSGNWFLLISLGIALWLLVDARGDNYPRQASLVGRSSFFSSCHLDTTDQKHYGVVCTPSLVSGVAFFDCNSTDVCKKVVNGSTAVCEYGDCSKTAFNVIYCKVRIKFTRLVENEEKLIYSYDLSALAQNCAGTKEFEIELAGSALPGPNGTIVTGLERATLSNVVIRDTEFNSDQIATYLDNNFRSAKKVSLIDNYQLFKLSSKTFRSLKELESVVVKGGSTQEIGQGAFNVRNQLTEIKLADLHLDAGKMSSKAIMVNDLTCRDRDLLISITDCELEPENLSEDAIVFNDGDTKCSPSTKVTIDVRSNEFDGLINQNTFEPLIEYSSKNNQSLVILYDPLKCCQKSNRWFFNLTEEERRTVRNSSCSDLTDGSGSVELSYVEDVDAQCKVDRKVVIVIILGVIITLILVFAGWVCFGAPKRSVIVLASHEKTAGSQNSTSYLKSARSGTFGRSGTKHKRRDDENSPTEIIMPIADHARNTGQLRKFTTADNSIATSEGAFIGPKSVPTLSKSSSSGKKLPHAEPKPAMTPRSPLDITDPKPVNTPRSPLFDTVSSPPKKHPPKPVSPNPKKGRHTNKKNKHKSP